MKNTKPKKIKKYKCKIFLKYQKSFFDIYGGKSHSGYFLTKNNVLNFAFPTSETENIIECLAIKINKKEMIFDEEKYNEKEGVTFFYIEKIFSNINNDLEEVLQNKDKKVGNIFLDSYSTRIKEVINALLFGSKDNINNQYPPNFKTGDVFKFPKNRFLTIVQHDTFLTLSEDILCTILEKEKKTKSFLLKFVISISENFLKDKLEKKICRKLDDMLIPFNIKKVLKDTENFMKSILFN